MSGGTETTIAGVANKVTYGGSVAAALGGWTANEYAAWGGLLIAAIGLAVQLYFKVRADKRHAEEHTARMAVLGRGEDDDG
jgi:hypothetical protein